MPKQLNSIGNYSFAYNSTIKSVIDGHIAINLPVSLETIGEFAFYGCYTMTSVTIPNHHPQNEFIYKFIIWGF